FVDAVAVLSIPSHEFHDPARDPDDRSRNARTDSSLFLRGALEDRTIASQLGIHKDAVRHAIESDRFHRGQTLRPSILDPYLEFVRQILNQHPRLRATRIYQMIRERGYTGSVVQLRRAVARLRPPAREAFLRLLTFASEHA